MKQENFLPIVDDWPRAGHVTKFWPMNCQGKSPGRFLGEEFAS